MDVRRYEELLFCITLSRAAHTSCIRYSSTGLHKYCFQSHVTPLDDALLPFSIRAPSHKLTEEEEEEVLGERERRRWRRVGGKRGGGGGGARERERRTRKLWPGPAWLPLGPRPPRRTPPPPVFPHFQRHLNSRKIMITRISRLYEK